MLVPLPSAIRVDPRRDAPRLEYAQTFHSDARARDTHTRYRPLPLLRYLRHADTTLAYTTSAATIAAPLLFFLLFSFPLPLFLFAAFRLAIFLHRYLCITVRLFSLFLSLYSSSRLLSPFLSNFRSGPR